MAHSPHRHAKGCSLCKPHKNRRNGDAARAPWAVRRKLGRKRRFNRGDWTSSWLGAGRSGIAIASRRCSSWRLCSELMELADRRLKAEPTSACDVAAGI